MKRLNYSPKRNFANSLTELNELFQTIRQFDDIPDRMRTRAGIDSKMGVGVYEKTPMTAAKSPKYPQRQKAYYI